MKYFQLNNGYIMINGRGRSGTLIGLSLLFEMVLNKLEIGCLEISQYFEKTVLIL